jgi:hypothetical protein
MNKLPVFITRVSCCEDAMDIQYGRHMIAQPSSMSLTLEGYFSIHHQSDYLMLRGHQGTGTAFLLSCTEDEMIMVQNLLTTIRG